MEESEQRRERLRAMRLEANAEVVSSSSSQQTLNSNFPPPLANPLLENEDSAAAAATPPPRFDYYTDPMAAYSADKRRPFTPRPHLSPSPSGPRHPEMPFSGAHQFQNNYALHQGMYHGGDQVMYYSPRTPGPTSSPMGIRNPYPVHQGNFGGSPGRGHWFNNNPSPAPPGSGYGGSPFPAHQGTPNFRSPPQGRGHWSNNSPNPGQGRGGGPGPIVGRGRGQWDGNMMSPSSGYSGGSGRGRGRGRGYDYGHSRSFYNKSMVEDPWESLMPVIWQGEKENDVKSFSNSRRYFQKTPTFQKTPSAKKARVTSPLNTSNSNKSGSLAEFLAESFDEAVEDAANM